MATYVGRPLKRFEDPRLVTGQGSFVDDLRLPGMLHAVVLRSPHAHARILSLDAAPARAAWSRRGTDRQRSRWGSTRHPAPAYTRA